jgi:pimeloyl-ACP methyl ester carboxylesterase
MATHPLETHRRTTATALGDISHLDVGDGPTAVFVHGVATNALLWRNVLPLVADVRRCVAIDLPLHGHTPAAPGQDFTLPGLAAVVEALCDALGTGQVDLVANDSGGAIAQVVAARRPDLLRTLTLTNCDVHDNLPPAAFQDTVDAAAAGLLSATGPAFLEDLTQARAIAFDSGYQDLENLDLDVAESYLRPVFGTTEHAREFERLLVSLTAADLLAVEPELRRLTVPTLVAWGTDDPFFEIAWAHWLRETVPGVTRVVEIDKARLFWVDERGDELAPLLRQHWAENPGAA